MYLLYDVHICPLESASNAKEDQEEAARPHVSRRGPYCMPDIVFPSFWYSWFLGWGERWGGEEQDGDMSD